MPTAYRFEWLKFVCTLEWTSIKCTPKWCDLILAGDIFHSMFEGSCSFFLYFCGVSGLNKTKTKNWFDTRPRMKRSEPKLMLFCLKQILFMMYFISKLSMYILCIQFLHSEQSHIGACMNNLGSFAFYICFTFLDPNTSIEVNLIFLLPIIGENVNLQGINLYIHATAACLPVCLAVSLRRKTCVLCQSDSVFLMAYCTWTRKLNCFLCSSTSCLFYTQQVLFYYCILMIKSHYCKLLWICLFRTAMI